MCVDTLHYARHLSKNKYIFTNIKFLKGLLKKPPGVSPQNMRNNTFSFYFCPSLTYSITGLCPTQRRKSRVVRGDLDPHISHLPPWIRSLKFYCLLSPIVKSDFCSWSNIRKMFRLLKKKKKSSCQSPGGGETHVSPTIGNKRITADVSVEVAHHPQ